MRTSLTVLCFLLAAVVPLFLKRLKERRWGIAVTVRVDPAAPSAADLSGYFTAIAVRLDEKPERMRMTVIARNMYGFPVTLDSDGKGAWIVTVGPQAPVRMDLRRRWIADHPVPLALTEKKKAVLYIEPVDANRFRVRTALSFTIPPAVSVGLSLLAAVGFVFLIPECLAASLGGVLGCLIAGKKKKMQ